MNTSTPSSPTLFSIWLSIWLFIWTTTLLTLFIQQPAMAKTYPNDGYQCEMPNIAENTYDHISCLHEGLSHVSKNVYHKKSLIEKVFLPFSREKFTKKHGFVDSNGKVVIPLQYDNADNFYEGRASVNIGCRPSFNKNGYSCLGGNWGFINRSDDMVISPEYTRVGRFNNGLALIKKDKFGFINTDGEPVILPKYEELYEFHNGLALAKLLDNNRSTLWQFIDKNDTPVITLASKEHSPFLSTARLALIKQNNKLGYVHESGKIIIQPQFEQAEEFRYMQTIKTIDSYDSATATEELIVEDLSTGVNRAIAKVRYPKHKSLKGIAKVTKDGQTYYIDHQGNKLDIALMNP